MASLKRIVRPVESSFRFRTTNRCSKTFARRSETRGGQAAGLVDTLGRPFVRAIGLYRRDIRRHASCESLKDLFTVRFAPHTR